MLLVVINIVSFFIIVLGLFFILAGTVGMYRSNNFYMKIQCAKLITIYGMTFLFFGIGINSFDSSTFFKTLFLIILNILTSLSSIHALSRKAFLSGVQFDCKERVDEEEEFIKEAKDELERQRREEEEKIKEQLLQEERLKRLKEEELERQRKEEEEKYIKENESLKEKIREQKRKLKEKIRKARMNARITRKQEEIDKTENMIKEILTKYDLTEEMLEDDED